MKKKLLYLFFLSLTYLSLPQIASASVPDDLSHCAAGQIYTGIGCIPVSNTGNFTEFILRWALGIAGGVALVMIAYSGIQMATAAGNPQKVQAAKELFTASAAGLLFMVFSAFILRFVGIDIFQIPGL